MKNLSVASIPDPREELYRSMGAGHTVSQLREQKQRQLNALRGYYRDLYPYHVVARYLWPDEDARRYLSIQHEDDPVTQRPRYSKPLTPEELSPSIAGLQHLLQTQLPWVLHMGALARPIPIPIHGRPSSSYAHAHGQTLLFHLQHELVIDLDVRDWETQRPGSRSMLCACDNTSSCRDCWVLVVLAATVCRVWLGEILGLGPMLVASSGSKGAHFHFASRRARALSSEQRRHLAQQMFARTTRQQVAMAPADSLLARIGDAVLEQWRAILTATQPERLPAATRQKLGQWVAAKCRVPAAPTWAALEQSVPRPVLLGAVLELAWPVVDANVLKDQEMKHTIKLPFSVHVKSGRLALPISDPRGDCDPRAMPTPEEVCASPHSSAAHLFRASVQSMADWLGATADAQL